MTLQKKYPCPYHNQFFLGYLHHPEWCVTCRGTLEWEGDVTLEHYNGEFEPIDYMTIGTSNEDLTLYVDCVCGDEVFLSEGGDTKVCKCGRIYRLYVSVKVDETHIGEIDWLIEESNNEHRSRFSS